jgi:RHS repeat-associated protein
MGEKFSANPVTGSGSFSIPIPASPARGEAGPKLNLIYDSAAGNGPFGLGWTLNLPSIRRKTDKGLPQYDDAAESDVFLFAGAEDLVPVLRGDQTREQRDAIIFGQKFRIRAYRPRIEGAFALIERWTPLKTGDVEDSGEAFWRVVNRENVTSWFGRTSSSRVHDPDSAAHVFEWLLCEINDDRGNVSLYDYKIEDGADVDAHAPFEANRACFRTPAPGRAHAATYLKSIKYGNRLPFLRTLESFGNWPEPSAEPDAFMFEMIFDYGEHGPPGDTPSAVEARPWTVRPDAFSTHRGGFDLRTWRLCQRILMMHHFPSDPEVGLHCPIWEGVFTYDHGTMSQPNQGGAAYTLLRSFQMSSFQRRVTGFAQESLPPIKFSYSQARIEARPSRLSVAAAQGLPIGLEGEGYRWIDLDGEGLSGVLCEDGGAWRYAPNQGQARFGPMRPVTQVPSGASLQHGAQQLLDIDGDGRLELVSYAATQPGYQTREATGGWTKLTAFEQLPNLEWNSPHLRFVDLTGDGHADIVIAEDELMTWHPSLGNQGFGERRGIRQALDEDVGPRLVFSGQAEAIFIADMTGDGLADIVRIRSGEICYWPNLGYGRFGRRIVCAGAPRFADPDVFDSQRLRIADVDGTGPADLIYLGSEGADLYLSLSGNGYKSPIKASFPLATENLSSVNLADLFGDGTACLVWNSSLPADKEHPVQYLRLMADGKPHLMTKIDNCRGLTTDLSYTPSTEFYLADKRAGRPWITRLPFPVHCVSRITTSDKWRGTRFSSRFSYHHGYFDGVEREFCGFARVEQIDIDTFDEPGLDQPPVLTISWFHTGAPCDYPLHRPLEQEYFTQRFHDRLEDGPNAFKERAIPDPKMPTGLSSAEWREARRALKGLALRQETYEIAPSEIEFEAARRVPVRLFTVVEKNAQLERLQPKAGNAHAVFLVSETEVITYHHDLDLQRSSQGDGIIKPDPRVTQEFVLRRDSYGNPLQSVTIGYPRFNSGSYPVVAAGLAAKVQAELHITYAEQRFTNALPAPLTGPVRYYRLPLPCETKLYSLEGQDLSAALGRQPGSKRYFEPDNFANLQLSDTYPAVDTTRPSRPMASRPYHQTGRANGRWRRLIEHQRSLYFDDQSDSTAPTQVLPFGYHGPRGIKYEDYKLALTSSLLDSVIGADRLDTALPTAGLSGATVRNLLFESAHSGYVPGLLAGENDQRWLRSGAAEFGPGAPARFFLPDRYRNCFGAVTTVTYSPDANYIRKVTDAAGNATEVLKFDNRVLAPAAIADINGNRTEVAFNIHGMVVATALMGKHGAGGWEGDDLSTFSRNFDWLNPPKAEVTAFCNATTIDDAKARIWLGPSTVRFVYDYGHETQAGVSAWAVRMASAAAISRETHAGQLPNGSTTRIQIALTATDGGGAPIMQKIQAEPDPVTNATRYVVNGETQLNNKGKPVRQYEPAFSSIFGPEKPSANGVSTTLFYDALGRLVRSQHPDGSLSRVVFSPWESAQFDQNDTVLEGTWLSYHGRGAVPASDSLVRAPGLPPFAPDAIAGWIARRHAGTPNQTILDSLGRAVISVAHNRIPGDGDAIYDPTQWNDVYYVTFTRLDPEGKPLFVRDANGKLVMQYLAPPKPVNDTGAAANDLPPGAVPAYDIAGNLLFQFSMDAGARWSVMDASGQPLMSWDENTAQDDAGNWWEEKRLYHTSYDLLRRPLAQWLIVQRRARGSADPFTTLDPVVIERFEYQDAIANDPANLNGQAVAHFDASGVTRLLRRSFAGHTEQMQRQLVRDKRTALTNWQAPLTANDLRLDTERFEQTTAHDAMGRMIRQVNWHPAGTAGAVYEPGYNRRGMLDRETLTLQSNNAGDTAQVIPAIANIAYDAKGQIATLRRGNGVITNYSYDPLTFRLIRLQTVRAADQGLLQDLAYTYDAAGNIIHVADQAQDTVYFSNAQIKPASLYIYDALYRLIETNGREQAGMTQSPGTAEEPWAYGPMPSDQTLRPYKQRYVYDATGNFERFEHIAGPQGSFTRHYETAADSNRVLRSWEGASGFDPSAPRATAYGYDTHGSMLNLTQGQQMLRWDHRDMIRLADLGGGGKAWYQYDAGKQRTRKFIERNGAISEERLYLGGYERFRRWRNGAVIEEIESWHLFAGDDRLLLVESVTASENLPLRTNVRYQLSNQLGSVAAEVDDSAMARIISYEEYHPYGTSAFRVMNGDAAARAPPKRYRYTGMERDEETGLACHGARYLLVTLGRWASADPIGVSGGLNLYEYAKSNPIGAIDTSGKQPVTIGAPDRYQQLATAPDYIREHWAPTGTVKLRLEAALKGKLSPSELTRLLNSARNNTVTSLIRSDVAAIKTLFDNARTAAAKGSDYVGEAEYLQTVKDTRATMRSTLATTGEELKSVPKRVSDAYAASIKAEQVGLQYANTGQLLPRAIAPLLRQPVAAIQPAAASQQLAQVHTFVARPAAPSPTIPEAASPAPAATLQSTSQFSSALRLGGAVLGTAADVADASNSTNPLYVTAKVTTAATQGTGAVLYASGLAAAAPEAVAAGSYLAAVGGAASLAVGSVALAVNETNAALEGKETAIHKAVVAADKLRNEGERQGGIAGSLKQVAGTVGTGLILLDFLQGNGVYGSYRY